VASTATTLAPTTGPERGTTTGTWLPGSVLGRAGAPSYFVYKPSAIGRRSRVPMLVLLHGCGQTAADFAAATRFNELADRHGFIAVYPEQNAWSHQQRCWRWYESAHQERGAGEPAIIADITATVLAEAARWRIDPTRVYVAGLSAGGGMALILAATYPDVYAAVGIHSGPAYGSAASVSGALTAMAGRASVPPPREHPDGGQGMPPAVLFQGTEDTTVRLSNGREVAEQWLAYRQAYVNANNGATAGDRIARAETRVGRVADGHPYTTTEWYTERGRKTLEYWQVDGLGHAWSGGAAGGSFSDPRGPDASTAMWSFFSRQRRAPARAKPAAIDMRSQS
jgi:poly(hydroxyalkanoate) depolymerase family esterase